MDSINTEELVETRKADKMKARLRIEAQLAMLRDRQRERIADHQRTIKKEQRKQRSAEAAKHQVPTIKPTRAALSASRRARAGAAEAPK